MSDDNRSSPALIEYHSDPETPTSIAVIEAITVIEDVDPTALSQQYESTLYDAIDPDYLDRLVRGSGDTDGFEVVFTVFGYRVRIENSTRILLYKAE